MKEKEDSMRNKILHIADKWLTWAMIAIASLIIGIAFGVYLAKF